MKIFVRTVAKQVIRCGLLGGRMGVIGYTPRGKVCPIFGS